MAVQQVGSIEGYLALLNQDRAEVLTLRRELLIPVTSFFRDPDAFDALRLRLAEYVRRRVSGEPLRVWVPGCATGEEVYTLAMLNPPKAAIIAAGVTYKSHETYAELANIPVISPEDVLVDTRMNIRYHVTGITPTTHRGALISQFVTLGLVDERSILYTIPIEAPETSLLARGWLLTEEARPTLIENRAQVPT
jgi:hypothetical protein